MTDLETLVVHCMCAATMTGWRIKSAGNGIAVL